MSKGNESAFPRALQPDEALQVNESGKLEPLGGVGLTKREYFAGVALQGLLTGHYVDGTRPGADVDDAARSAVAFADALLAEFGKAGAA